MKELLSYAKRFGGIAEIVGKKHNPIIVEWSHEIGHKWVDNDEMPWCSVFINMIAKRYGYEYTKKLNARSWLDIGIPIDSPVEGCIVIFSRGSNPAHGHVGLWEGENGKLTQCYSGNQGNMVCSQDYETSRVLGYRILNPYPIVNKFKHQNESLTPYECRRIDEICGEISELVGVEWTLVHEAFHVEKE